MGVLYVRGEVYGFLICDFNGKIIWMDKFVNNGNEIIVLVLILYFGMMGFGGFEWFFVCLSFF